MNYFLLAFGIFYVFFKLGYYVQPRTILSVLGEIISMMIIIGTITGVIGGFMKASIDCETTTSVIGNLTRESSGCEATTSIICSMASRLTFVTSACGIFASGAVAFTGGLTVESQLMSRCFFFIGWASVAIGLWNLWLASMWR
jgi:hypothetical protein